MAMSFRFQSAARTHIGCVRRRNEDAFVDRPKDRLWAVADGMGGHQGGALASGLIVQALSDMPSARSEHSLVDATREQLGRVNRTLVERAAQLDPGSVIGSTAVVLIADGSRFTCLWAGDSRCYVFRQGELRRLSHDHSVVQELIDSGELSPEDARTSRRANVITRAVGVYPELEVDQVEGEVEASDLYLLCSDGLTGMMEDEEIAALLQGYDLDAAADGLIGATLDRGARDNVTVVLIRADQSSDS
ncbi:PP2C family protein-serine/threonine phosphatase [Phenylobacterium montanum]|uniref:Serine/threonine-protein phosphatase n=1 Tax=Phenylobacterium montanum TaxID=2823693 RepID=A0A975FZW1_9CAUL|nr:protein phosphatase 2C domain-containing protein [Caulobacter sp. S6]QUD88014.1 serine/threonine-protein phosphatase [Caulobacter sp. S6]